MNVALVQVWEAGACSAIKIDPAVWRGQVHVVRAIRTLVQVHGGMGLAIIRMDDGGWFTLCQRAFPGPTAPMMRATCRP